MKTITPKTHTVVSIMIFTFCFFASVRAAEESGESRVARLVNTPASTAVANEVARLTEREQKKFLDMVCSSQDYFRTNKFRVFHLVNTLMKKEVDLDGHKTKLISGFNFLGPPPGWISTHPASKYYSTKWKDRLIQIVATQDSRTTDQDIEKLVQEKTKTSLFPEERRVVEEQVNFVTGRSHSRLQVLLTKTTDDEKSDDEDEDRNFSRSTLPIVPGSNDTEKCDNSQQTTSSSSHSWLNRFQGAVLEGNSRYIQSLVQEKARGELSQKEREIIQNHMGFLTGDSYTQVSLLLAGALPSDTANETDNADPFTLLKENKIKEAAKKVSRWSKEKQREVLNRVLAPDYNIMEVLGIPLLLHEFEQAGVELDSVRPKIETALAEYGLPGQWEKNPIYRFWPKDMLSPWSDRVKRYCTKAFPDEQNLEWAVKRELLMEKVDTRLTNEESILLATYSASFEFSDGILKNEVKFLLDRHTATGYWDWARSFEVALSYGAANTVKRLLQKKQNSTLSQEEVNMLERKKGFLSSELQDIVQSLMDDAAGAADSDTDMPDQDSDEEEAT